MSVDAFAIAATFGELCPNGRPCAGITNFISRDAGFAHENATVEDVLDLLRSSVLMAEQQWVELRGIVHNAGQGKPLFAYTSGMFPSLSVAHEHASTSPAKIGWGGGCMLKNMIFDSSNIVLITTHLSPCISAPGMYAHTADYGWRTTWDQLFEPNGCQSCLYARSFSLALCLLKQQCITLEYFVPVSVSYSGFVLVETHECSPSHVYGGSCRH